jgi:glyoxylase-like metal-dependent hydrolase (beta-lactamase superfamily II)
MTIHFIKGRYVNSYLVEEGDKIFVVDVAMRGGEKFVLGYIEQVLKRDVGDVSLVLCTHDDPDHIGGVHALARECDAQVAMPFASRSLMLKNINNPLGVLIGPATILVESFRPRMWSMYMNSARDSEADKNPVRKPEKHARQEKEQVINVEERSAQADFLLYHKMLIPEFEDWQVLHTPGHSWDSMCLFHKPSRVIISGDTLLCSKKKNQVVMPAIYTNPFQMKRSINKLRKLNPTAIYPAHGTALHGEGLLDHL